MIEYQVSLHYPEAHLFRVKLICSTPDKTATTLRMAAWIPGSYMIRDFSRNVIALQAEDNNGVVRVEKIDKQTWIVAPCAGQLKVTYDVYAFDLSVRGSFLDITRAFITGTSLFLSIDGREHEQCEVKFSRPKGERFGQWRLATTLPRKGANYLQFGRYQANSFADLIDHPVEMGDFLHEEFSVREVPHNILISGHQDVDVSRLGADLKKICNQHIELFGGLPGMERYLFQVTAVGDGYGGLEHKCSTSLICKRSDLPAQNSIDVDEGYRRFLGLCSHEYFHLWNVKRIRPSVFSDPDLTREVHTTLLWAFEGITSYYDDLALVRSGVITEKEYLELLAQLITRYLGGSGRFKQTVAQSSFDAWTKFYKQDENASNAIVSYYTKGALVALVLDLHLRRISHGKRSLDHVMRRLWEEFGLQGIGIEEGDIERIVDQVGEQPNGDFFDSYVYGVDELPLVEMLAGVGISMQLFPAGDDDEKGGFSDQTRLASDTKLAIGARVAVDPQGLKVLVVYDEGAAQRAGLSVGDVIVAMNGIKASMDELKNRMRRSLPGDVVVFHAFRRDILMEFQVELQQGKKSVCYLSLDATASSHAEIARKSWLGLH